VINTIYGVSAANYIAKQQKTLANRLYFSHNVFALGTFTGVGAYPPKPPPLVEPQRSPKGLRFFFVRTVRWPVFSLLP
jgi:hypothetical protein